MEKYFLWGEDQCERNSLSFQPLTTPWIGVLHVPPLTPKWAGNQFSQLYNSKQWIESLKSCKCLIALSEYMANDLKLLYPELNIKHFKHPMQSIGVSNQFDENAFKANPKIVLSGYWLRDHHFFYEWDAPFQRIHLIKDMSLEFMHQEFSVKGKPNNLFAEKVLQLSYLPNDEYDDY